MIEGITLYSVRNPFVILCATLGVLVMGVACMLHTPVDAIPDLSENQVIVFTDWMGRSPREIEDQITYPLSVNLQGLAGVKAVRSSSEFNFSMINVIFEDGTDFYFARTRVLERLSIASTFLPPGVVPYMAPDATALGQIFWYTVEGEGRDLGELRAIQDWYVRYQLSSVPGVAQVATAGGLAREYQIDVDPNKLRAYGITLGTVFSAVARSNSSVGGKLTQEGGAEYLIRGVGWIQKKKDIEDVVLAVRAGVPITVRQVAAVQIGPEFRRSILEKDGREAVGGVVMMRYGENPLEVTRRVKEKIAALSGGLPAGVRIVPFYDRTRLIEDAIHTVRGSLTEAMITSSVAVILVMNHVGAIFVICVTLPLAALTSLILMYLFHIPSNIMSLAGIAISIGVLVDSSIVVAENAAHTLSRAFPGRRIEGDTTEIVGQACRLVGRPVFFSVLIMLISFIPVFALTGQEGKMFHPLAFTKSFALLGAAILSITLVPALCPIFLRGRLAPEEDNWIVRGFIQVYRPVMEILMPHPKLVCWLFMILIGIGLNLARRLGREFMPPLDEGSLMDMPTSVPRISLTQAGDDLQVRDAIIRGFPEVERVVGKVGRADTPTDPSPPDMVETIITLEPRGAWTRRRLHFDDAIRGTRLALDALERAGVIRLTPAERSPVDQQRAGLVNAASMDALARFDETMRGFAMRRKAEAAADLARALALRLVGDLGAVLQRRHVLAGALGGGVLNAIGSQVAAAWGARLVDNASAETIEAAMHTAGEALVRQGLVRAGEDLYAPLERPIDSLTGPVLEALGQKRPSLAGALAASLEAERLRFTAERTRVIDWEIEDQAAATYLSHAEASLVDAAHLVGALARPPADGELARVRGPLESSFAGSFYLWRSTKDDVLKEMDSVLQMPGWGNIWTQPIINRVDMLATGVRTMIGVKVFGDDLAKIQEVSEEIARVLRAVPGAVDVFPDQTVGKSYIEITVDREKAARYGINVGDIQDTIEVALGGKPITQTVEGRRRFPVRVRYARAYREDVDAIGRILVTGSGDGGRGGGGAMGSQAGGAMGARSGAGQGEGMAAGNSAGGMPASGSSGMGGGGQAGDTEPPPGGAPRPASAPRGVVGTALGTTWGPTQVPLAKVARIAVVEGPSMIKSENGMLRAYVQLNVRDRDVVGFVEEAQRAVARSVVLPQGFSIEWSGQFEHQVRARRTLTLIMPIVLVLILVILYITYHDFAASMLVVFAVPGALAGGVIFQYLFGYAFSVAVWVGYIAAFGMATSTGIVMLVYLREALERHGGLSAIRDEDQLREVILEGAVHRLRPKLLTEGTAIIGLVPMLWATGAGAEIIKPMACPVLGGLLAADEVIDVTLPVLYHWLMLHRWRKLRAAPPPAPPPAPSPAPAPLRP